MEGSIRRLDGVKNAKIDFASGRLTIEIEDRGRVRQITEEAEKIIKGIESHVEVIDERKIKGHMDAREEKAEEGGVRKEVIRLVAGSVLLIIPTIFKFNFYLEFAMFFISYLLVGCEVLTKAVRNIARGEVFDENFLMTIATIGAFVIGEFPEGVAVMLFYQIGEMFQDMAVNRSRKSISALMDIRPDYANLKLGDDVERVSPEEVEAGDIILVKPGERIPLDGVVIDGKSMVDTSTLTGESLPREVIEGDEVLGGFINKNGALTVRVTKEFGESTVSKILDLVQNASSRKAKTENFITKFARYYTPAVVFTALVLAAIPPIVLPGARFSDWFYRALIFLVISCPCALVVSIPLGFFGGIGGASRNGILVKGSNYLEALNYVDTVVFDKTGTLTKGVFNVTEVNPADGIGKDELLRFAALCESHSNHPIALSILKAYGEEINKEDIESYEEIPGYGIKVFAGGREILAGNAKLMKMKNISFEEVDAAGTIVNVAVDGKYAGHIIISDEIKEDSERAIRSLKALGVKRTVMLTGDVKSVGEKVASGLGIDEVFAELLPHEKVERVEELSKKEGVKGKIAFVGDGINDAPVLARADVGIAMGGLGSDAAIEAADVVIMTDEPSKVAGAIGIARRTRRIVWQNIIFALGVKLFVLLLGALGMASMWAAVFADVGVALIAVLNAMRVLNVRDV